MPLGTQHRWKVLGAGVAANACFSCVVGGIPATAVFLRSGYQLSSSALGWMLGILGLGIAISEIPWGLLTDRWGDRPVLLSGLSGVALVLLWLAAGAGNAPTVVGLGVGLFVAGVMGSSVNGASGRAIMLWFHERERGLAMSIRQTAVPGGYALGAVMMPWLAQAYGFRAVFGAAGVLCLVCCVLVAAWIQEPSSLPARPTVQRASPLGDPQVWRSAAAISLLCAPQFAVLTYAAVFFHDAVGLKVTTVSIVLALVQLGAIVGRLWSGRWTDRMNNRRVFLKACALFSALAFLGLSLAVLLLGTALAAATVVLPIAVLAAGVVASIWHGVAYAELATVAGIQRAGTALAMGNTGVFLVLFVTPIAASAAVSHWGWSSLWALCALCALAAAALFPGTARRSHTVTAAP